MSAPQFDLRASISKVEANRGLKDTFAERLKARGERQSISVTDLVALRPAFYDRVRPDIEPGLERKELMLRGSGFHEQFGRAVSREEYLEQFVEMEGITGRIDIYEQQPLELKTTRSGIQAEELASRRPSWLEQLGMYCAMVDREHGRLLVYNRGGPDHLLAFSMRFPDLPAVQSEMSVRRDLLAKALEDGSPDSLPVCPWSGKGCIYEAEGICSCAEIDAVPTFPIAELAAEIARDDGIEMDFTKRLARPAKQKEGIRITDLVFPRKAYFAAKTPPGGEGEMASRLESYDRYGLVRELISRGLAGKGELTRRPVELGPIRDRVLLHKGAATAVRVSEFREPVQRWQLPDTFRHYVLRVAFDAALAGTQRGRLVVYYRNASSEDAKLMVYDTFFKDLDGLVREAERRAHLLVQAMATGSPDALPTCPAWMHKFCEFKDRCGCGAGAA